MVCKSKMWILLFFVLSGSSLLVSSMGNDDILGEGDWIVLNILQCDEPEQYEMLFTLSRRKVNRTHDGFTMHADLDREINFTYAVEVIAYQEVDGGYKYFQRMADDCFCNFVAKYTGDNWPQLLKMANVDPPECPIPPGEFNVVDFVLNNKQVADQGVYGTYDVFMYLLYEGRKVGCQRAFLRYEKSREDEDDDDDDEDDDA